MDEVGASGTDGGGRAVARSSYAPAPDWAVRAADDLSSLGVDEFGDWQREAGIPELQVLLLLGWDPHSERAGYPESLESYQDIAHSILLGLRMGDTRPRSIARLSKGGLKDEPADQSEFYSEERLSALIDEIKAWLPRSIARWWRRRVGDQLRSLPFHCHLIKYDSSGLVAGHFDDGSWTAYGDVGETFDGVVLTKEVYEATERAHLNVVEVMARESEAASFVADLEHDDERAVDIHTMLEQVRGALRGENEVWLWRTPDNSMYVVNGYDYHLYVGSHVECTAGVGLAIERGLNPRLDEGPSPHLLIG